MLTEKSHRPLPRILLTAVSGAALLGLFFFSQNKAGLANGSKSNLPANQEQFNAYWNQGKAELSVFDLKQARYSEIHRGEAILITVTEPFLPGRQVKSELASNRGEITVLKTQLMKRFATGIYDYQLTTTAFKPLYDGRFPYLLKTSTTSVDWCGHTFLQVNFRDNQYEIQSRSYFESESDEDFKIGSAFPEDEIFSRLRIDPGTLPQGDFKVIPSAMSLRLRHKKASVLTANGQLRPYNGKDIQGKNLSEYHVTFSDDRELSVIYTNTFPYSIKGFKETYAESFGQKKRLTTLAVLKSTKLTDYWARNKNSNSKDRKELGVTGF